MTEYLDLLWNDYTVRTITLGTAVLGAVSGVLGSFAVLRMESLLGDAISHASLPGIALAFLITGAKDSGTLLLGALIVGLLALWWIRGITTKTHLKSDTALGIVLSVFFGFGMMLLTFIQKMPDANQAGLDKYLFGQAATLVERDVRIMIWVTLVAAVVLLFFWKEFKIMLFDMDYTHTIGFHTGFLDALISFFIVLAIVLGLQTVGVVLMSAIILAPAAAARQWTNSLGVMLFLAGMFGAVSGVTGTGISAMQDNLSTGPVIVLAASVIVLISLMFSPGRGLVFRQIRHYRNRRNFHMMKTLQLMYDIARDHEDIGHPHAIGILNNFLGHPRSELKTMVGRGWITIEGKEWSLTEKGYKQAAEILQKKHTDE